MITKNTPLGDFLRSSVQRIQNDPYALDYYHVLTARDEKPVVRHLQTDQCTIVLEGNGIAVIDDESFQIERDSIVMIPAGSSHQFISSQEKMVLFHFHIPQETASSDRTIISGKDFTLHGKEH